MFFNGAANFDFGPHFGPHECKAIETRRFEAFEVYDPYTPNVIRSLKDKPVRLPQDKRIPTTYIQATEPENATGGDVWIRG